MATRAAAAIARQNIIRPRSMPSGGRIAVVSDPFEVELAALLGDREERQKGLAAVAGNRSARKISAPL